MDVEEFEEDLDTIISNTRIKDPILLKRIDNIKRRLTSLYKKNQIKINHSVMELLVVVHLLKYGYESIEVEKQLSDILRCDVYAKKGDGDMIVEIETGFVPPDHALDPLLYYKARLASKIARYSQFASKFMLATPQQSILPIPELFIKPVKARSSKKIAEVKSLCDIYYKNPSITLEDIQYGRLHSIFIINIDDVALLEFDPIKYVDILNEAFKEFDLTK